METKSEVVIVSAFGRGNWLATELKTLGLDVVVADVTEHLGRWSPEDIEGPFGLFQPELLSQSQRARLDEEDYSEAIEEGFILWLKSGPVDLRGPHSSYLLEKLKISNEAVEYISRYDVITPKRRQELHKKFANGAFIDNWFVALSHSLASSVFEASREAPKVSRPLPLFAPYGLRRVTRRGGEKALDWLKSHHIRVHSKAKLKDLSMDGRTLLNIEVESEASGVLGADQFVWMLSSLETKRLNEKVQKEVFTNGVIEPDWVWARYHVDIQAPNSIETLPLKFVVVEDLALPWTHANLQFVQKTTSKENLDIWVRLPATHRFQKNYLEELGAQIINVIKNRIPQSEPKILEYPQDYHYDETVLGPSRFNLFSSDKLKSLKRRNFNNIHYDGPELWDSLDWNGQFRNQSAVFENIKSWKIERDRKIEKQRAKEAKA